MNPESLDTSIQSALSALFPPFEVTAPTVLSQLFRLIEERYSSDALQCLLDFLIPSKHLLESIQQAACAGYSDVVFRCEGWPLCLHDKTVIQLATVNPLLLRPGDFYLQVEPFADQAVRIVLKSLLEEGCREVEETPIPETSYPCMFTEEWLQDLNEGRHGTPLSCCLLCTDQGVVKLPWAKIAIPEFLDKPKITPMYQEITPQKRKQMSVPSHFNSSTLPVEAIFHPSKDRMSASLRPVDCGFRRIPKSHSKPVIKPVGWVSPNNWDSPETRQEIEGDYVDLVDITKGQGKDTYKQNDEWLQSSVLKPVRPPSLAPCGNGAPCACPLQYAEEAGHKLTDHHLKCSYRDSYVVVLRNPVEFKKGSVDHLAAFGEVGLPDGALPSKSMSRAKNDQLENVCNNFNEPSNNELQQYRQSSQTKQESIEKHVESESLMEDPPVVLNSSPGLRHSEKVTMKLISKQPDPNASVTLDVFLENNKPHRTAEAKKTPGKQHVKVRSLSTVSETSKGSPVLYKLSSRSYSDVCPDTISSVMQLKKGELLDQMSQKLERRNSPRKDLLSSRSESPSVMDGPVSKLHNSKTERLSSSLQSFETQNSSQSGQPSFRIISGLLELGIICLPGSRDRTGRSVVEVHGDRKEWMSPLVSAQNVCELLLYLHSIPRKEIRELGMTLVINARKKAPPLHLYKALLMAQEQALHAVHSIVMLVDKDTCPRPEKYPGLQMDLVTSMKALNKTVEASQLTSNLGGSFTYSHADWLQFHQRLVSFMADLREADSLLQKAIRKVDEHSKLDTAQEVQQCIEEQRYSMKEVLEDARLVTLQREGGAVLARIRREDFRFPQSEDYRDTLESVTVLYNQVEEKLHTLVMRSNESLQHLDFLFRLRKMESKISTVGMWLNSEGEQMLKDSHTVDSLVCAEKVLHHYDLFLTQAKEKQRYALKLVTEAEEIVGLGYSNPATDIFGTLVRTFKSDIDDFMLRAEQRHKELETLLHVHSFCEQASALAKECSHFLEKVEQRCYSASTRRALKMYEERLGGEFSTLNFQAVKAKACAVGSGAAGAMKVWNAAWVQCQQLRQHLDKMQKTFSDKELIQQTTAAHPQPEDGGVEKTGKGTEAQQQNWHREDVKICEHEGGESNIGTSLHQYLQPDLSGNAPHATIKYAVFSQINGRPREHHSEADLRTVDPAGEDGGFPVRQHLGRSLSEGSHAGFQLPSSFLPLNVRNKHCQSRTQPLQLNLHPVHKQISCLNDSYGSRHLRSKSDGKDEYYERYAGSSEVPQHLTPETSVRAIGNSSNNVKLQKIMEELLITEREYVSALGYVREHYFPELERADVPQDLRGQRGIIFGNLEKLHDFHQHHFLSELESCVSEPFTVGRCFLRHKESFALYALYSKNKPQSDALFISHGQSFFKQKQMKLGDKMDLWSYLLKPVQRISKYSLLLQDMMMECGPRQTREIAEVKAALEVIHFQLRHGNNLLAMDAIQHCDVNLKEQGQLIRQDEFLVTFRKKKCFRHIFLFQELVLFSKTRKTEVGNDTYLYKQSFKTTDIGLTQNSGDTGLCFEIWFRKRKTQDTYTLQAVNPDVKEAWTRDLERILWEQAVHNREIRMQERVFMGIGNKPFMDIQPSEAAISNRAVNCVLIGRVPADIKLLCSAGSSRGLGDGLPGGRPKSLGSGSSSSSSSSSGIGSLSPVRYLCGPKNKVGSGGSGGYVSPPGALEEDDLDQGGVVHNLLLDSSESSGESVSGFSCSSHSFHSAIGGEAEDVGSVCNSSATVKVVRGAEGSAGCLRTSEEPLSSVSPKPKPQDISCDKAQSTNVGKSTVV